MRVGIALCEYASYSLALVVPPELTVGPRAAFCGSVLFRTTFPVWYVVSVPGTYAH